MLLLISTLAICLPAGLCASMCRGRGWSAWIAAFCTVLGCEIVLLSEIVGRWAYTPGTMTLASLGLGIVGGIGWMWRWRVGGRAFPPSWRRSRRVALATWQGKSAAVIWALIITYSILASIVLPPSVNDVIKYHLPPVVAWIQDGAIGIVPELDYRSNFFPHNVNLLNGWCMLLGGEWAVALPQVVISGVFWPAVMMVVLQGIGVRRRWRWFGAFLASMNSVVVLQMRNEMVDVGFYAPLILAAAVAISGTRLYRRPMALFALATGFAVGAKASGPAAAVVLGLVWVIACLWRGRGSIGARMIALLIGKGLAWSAAVIILGCGVYIQNLRLFGNPLYPFSMSLGPIEFPAADTSHMHVYLDDFGTSPLTTILVGIFRWPELLLGLGHFERYTGVGSGGYGPVVAVLCAAVLLLAIGRRWFGSAWRLPQRGMAFAGGIVATLLAWNLALLSVVDLRLAAPCDARYQLHLPVLLGCVCIALLSKARPSIRGWLSIVLLAASIHMTWTLLYRAPNRGYRVQLQWVLSGEKPREFIYSGRPIFAYRNVVRIDRAIEDDAAVLLIGRFPYPMFGPTLGRRVILVSEFGPHPGVVEIPSYVDEAVSDQCVKDIQAYFAERDFYDIADWDFDNEVSYNAISYYNQVARQTGATHLYSVNGRQHALDASPYWKFMFEEKNRRASEDQIRRNFNVGMALYKFIDRDERGRPINRPSKRQDSSGA